MEKIKFNTVKPVGINPNPPKVGVLDVVDELPEGAYKVVKGLANLGKDIFHGITRSGGSLVAQLLKPITGMDEIKADDSLTGKAQKLIFGSEPIPTLDKRVDDAMKKSKEWQAKNIKSEYGEGWGKSLPIVAGLVGGALPALDFTGLGSGSKTVIKILSKLGKAEEVANILRKINVAEDLVKEYAPVIAKTTKEAEVGKILTHIGDLQKTTQAVKNLPKLATEAQTSRVVKAIEDMKLIKPTTPAIAQSPKIVEPLASDINKGIELARPTPVIPEVVATKPTSIIPEVNPPINVGDFEVGATSFRGRTVASIEETLPYYDSTRAKGFERSLTDLAESNNIKVVSIERSGGLWEGKLEPSFLIKVKGTLDDVTAYLGKTQEAMRGKQDAFVAFKAGEGTGVKYAFSGVTDTNLAVKKATEMGIKGATAIDGKSFIVYDMDRSLQSQVKQLAEALKINPTETNGTVRFIEKSEYTTAASRRGVGNIGEVAPRSGRTIPETGLDNTAKVADSVPPQLPPNLPEINKLPPQRGDLRERGFLTSLKEDPLTSAVFQDETDLYSRLANTVSREKARTLIDTDLDAARALAYSGERTTEAVATRTLLITDAVKRGDVTEAKRLANFAYGEGTEIGRAAQAHALLNQTVDTPAKALITAVGQFDDFVKKTAPNFDRKLNQVGKELDEINKEAIDTIIKETPDLTPKSPSGKIPDLTNLVKKLSESPKPEELLAKRIKVLAKSPKPNPVKEMVETLYKIAQELLPKKGLKPPKSQIEVIGQALRDKDNYKDVWLKAQDIVRARYKDNPKALELLDEYFNKTLLSGQAPHAELPISQGTLNRAVQQGIKSESVDLGKIVREHYSVVNQAGKELTTTLVEKANVPPKEAMALAQKIQARFKQLTETKKESILKTMFAERKLTGDKQWVDRMIEMSNLGAFDKAQFREALATKLKLPVLTDDLARQLSEQAQVIAKTPFGYEKVKETEKLLKLISDQIPMSKAERAGQWLNIPRTIMSSFDLSFGLRQGIFTAPNFPKEWGSSFGKQFKMFASEKAYEKVMDATMQNPLFKVAEDAGLAFTDVGTKMTLREERFMSPIAERFWFIGKGVRASARAYTGMANKLRMDVFARMYKDAEKLGLDMADPKLLGDIAEFVNNATGRGSKILGMDITKSAPLLNAIFFSPRLMASRLTLITDPSYYIKADPFVRKQALKSLLTFAGAGMTVLGLAKLAGADVGTDPRSSDFAKIKIGDTRFDVFGGFQQYVRMAAQLITGEYVSSTTGKVTTLGEGYKPLTRWDILWRQLESKEAPVMSFITDVLKQQDYKGDKINIPKAVIERFTPMIYGDLRDLAKEDPELLPLGLLGTLGISVQTYPSADLSGRLKSLGSPNKLDLKNLNKLNLDKPKLDLKNSQPKR